MTTGHLTPEAIAAWKEKRLVPSERIAAIRHFGVCEPCREMACSSNALGRLDAAFQRTFDGSEDHPEYTSLEALADGEADPVTEGLLAVHLDKCEVCAAEYNDLLAFRETLRWQPRARRRIPFLPVFALLGSAVAILAIFLVEAPRHAASPREPDKAKTPSMVSPVDAASVDAASVGTASIHDAGSTIGLDAAGALRGLNAVPESDRELLRQVLQSRALPSSPDATRLRRTREVRLGTPNASQPLFRPLSPAGTVVPEATPEFRWDAPRGSSRFIVSVYTADFELAAKSPELLADHWTPGKPLADGVTFLWTVSAIIDDKRVTVPQAPDPEARFRVATARERRQFESARAAAPGSNLLQAAVAARLGMIDQARASLGRLAASNPGSAMVESLSASLQPGLPAPGK